jgi:6-phospho-beta-glucosidase
VNGRKITDAEFDRVAELITVNVELLKTLRMLCSPYLHYFFHTGKKVSLLKAAALTRGETVQLLEKEVFAAYADPAQDEKPAALAKRGGGGYSEVALNVMDAIYNNHDRWMVVNVPNRGTIKYLPDDAVIETGCLVNSAGIKPLALGETPRTVWGLISAVKNYEQLAVEAAVSGSRDIALLALVAHPLVRDYDVAKPLLNDLLEANRKYLPQFFKE